MLVKILIIIMLLLIAGSLFSALFFLMKGDSQDERVVKALTWRISLSLVLFLLLMLGFYTGIIGHP
jgi:drug/metabolite transporter (DMT)-like permease